MNVLISSCLLGNKVRWNGMHKLNKKIMSWADSNGITLVPVCPENELFGTPRPPIKLIQIEKKTCAFFKKKDIMQLLDDKAREIYGRYPDAVGFIGISKSPSCGISVGVKNLGRTIKGSMHKVVGLPTVEVNQLRSEHGREQFLRRIKKWCNEYRRSNC